MSSFDPLDLNEDSKFSTTRKETSGMNALLLSSIVLGTPSTAFAATAFAPNAIPSALASYGHYASLLGILACIMIERLTIKPNMTEKEEDLVAFADTGLGVWGVLIAYTGYLRVTGLEKGFDFYANEPIFWLKICFVGIFGAASFFNTTQVIKRAVARRGGEFEPMSDALAKRVIQICNAELVAISVIPLTATFMARGVLYSESIPWQAEAGLAAAVFAGLSFKYLKEAFTWED
mmetsp:Transcript_23383/g.32763  ORF Transcript_23383/g.32763 Transcript_23383/m.32763 type:complete len:234 (-) Transcript_23383:93-794(-)